MQFSIRDGVRDSTAAAYLRPSPTTRACACCSRAHARRLLFEGTRCVGVEWERDGRSSAPAAAR